MITLSDLGNAERFVAQNARDTHFTSALGWLIYDGKRYRRDETKGVFRLAMATVRKILRELDDEENAEQRTMIAKHAIKSEGRARLEAMVALAEAMLPIATTIDAFDADDMLLNVANGTIDLRTGALRPHRREDKITKLAPVSFDPAATCPLWHKFLKRVLVTDELIAFMQRLFGYALTGSTAEQALFVFWGTGRNGKGTVITTLTKILGGDHLKTTPAQTFMAKAISGSGAAPSPDLARLAGVRVAIATETGEDLRLDEGLVKAATGGDVLAASFKYKDIFEFVPKFKLIVQTNHKPIIRGTDLGIWSRIRLVPFAVTIPKLERDPNLGAKLAAELPGILAWAVEGCLAWQRDGLGEPKAVVDATETYRTESAPLTDFVKECCDLVAAATATSAALRGAYEAWCQRSGVRYPLGVKKFAGALTELGCKSAEVYDRAKKGKAAGWNGIALRSGASGSSGTSFRNSPHENDSEKVPKPDHETPDDPGPVGDSAGDRDVGGVTSEWRAELDEEFVR